MQRKTTFLLISMVAGLPACKEDPNTIDTGFFNDESFEITYVDTVGLVTSTIQIDSLQTSRTGRILFGFAEDEKLGKIKSTGFFKVGLDSTYELDEGIAFYDSLTLFLEFDGYYYYDTLSTQTYTLYGLARQLEFDEETGALYNTSFSELPYDRYLEGEPLGSFTAAPRPVRDEGVEFRLSDTVGRELIQLAFRESEILSNAGEFAEYLNGFALVPDSAVSAAIVGFTTGSQLRLYYQDKSVIPSEQKYLEFSIGDGPYFSQVIYDRSGTKLNGLITIEEDLNSVLSGNEVYMQSGAGLGIKVLIPHIKELIFDDDDFFINNATLTLKPVGNSYDAGTPLPKDLIVYIIDETNAITGGLENPALFIEDILLDRDTRYEINVTGFINNQLQIDEFNENALLLIPPDSLFRSTVDRVYVGDAENEYEMELTVLYVSLIED